MVLYILFSPHFSFLINNYRFIIKHLVIIYFPIKFNFSVKQLLWYIWNSNLVCLVLYDLQHLFCSVCPFFFYQELIIYHWTPTVHISSHKINFNINFISVYIRTIYLVCVVLCGFIHSLCFQFAPHYLPISKDNYFITQQLL